MSTTTAPGTTHPRSLRRQLFPSVISGLLLGVVAAIIVGIIVHGLASSQRTGDTTIVAAYVAFFFFFLIGVGAANYPWGYLRGRPDPTHHDELEAMGEGQGVWRYFRFCTDHKVVGIQYLVTVLVLFTVGGLGSWMIRLQQSQVGAHVFTPATYNTIVSMHGLIMIVTTIIMVSAVFGNYIVPIMIGANDMAFPRLNALSYWVLFPVIPILLSAIVLGGIPTGWIGYAPLADQASLGMDAYGLTIVIFGISLMLGALNMVVTVVTMRAPGMTWGRLPTLVWASVLSTLLGLMVFPAFTLAVLLVLVDRVFGASFYEASLGGNNWIYEQSFWFMGHPEVYVIVLPALGAIAEIVPVFTRKPLFGYRLVVGGMFGIFVLSMIVWMHHLYWSGANLSVDLPVMLSTELISIPTGLIFLALIGTLWRGRIRYEPPMLFSMAFIVNFLIGGVTGLYLADVPTDTVYHGNMFTVAHFHFTLVGSAVFGFLAAFYYWFPKMSGRQLDPLLSRVHFWLFEIGFLGIFLPLFYAGIRGEPRWQAYIDPSVSTENLLASLAVILVMASVAVFAYNILISWIRGRRAEVNQWGGRTLEWTIPSPVPLVNFERPVIVSAGPYDYGLGGPRVMGAPAIAGAAVDSAAPVPAPPPFDVKVRALQVRMAGLLVVLSWTVLGLGLCLLYIYLHALNTMDQFRPSSEPVPTVVGNLLVTLGALAGAALFTWGYRRSRAGDSARARTGVALGLLLTLAGLVGSVVVFLTYQAPLPLHGYASTMDMFILVHGWHLLVGTVIGGLVLGRLLTNRLGERHYVIQVVSWWLWYAATLSLIIFLLMVTIK